MGFDELINDLQEMAGAQADTWRSLPPAAYQSDELFALEAEHLFYRGWVIAGRVDQVSEPGDYLCFDVLDEPIVISRDRHGELHVLSREVCAGHGNVGAFVCPYHAWTYELDGRLRHATEMHKTPGFEPDSVYLSPVRHAVWAGFIFVNISGDAPPLEPVLAGAARELDGYDLASWVTVRSIELGEAPWDWKVFMDNGEIYHHLMLHRETVEPRSPANLGYTGAREDDYFILYGPAAPEILIESPDGKQTMPSYLEQVGNWSPSRLSDTQRTSAAYFYAYPNYVVALWVNIGIFFQVVPLGSGRSRLRLNYMVPRGFVDHPQLQTALDRAVDAFSAVHAEDTIGLHRGATRGAFSLRANRPRELSRRTQPGVCTLVRSEDYASARKRRVLVRAGNGQLMATAQRIVPNGR